VLWRLPRAGSLRTRRWWRENSFYRVLQPLLDCCLLNFVASHLFESSALQSGCPIDEAL